MASNLEYFIGVSWPRSGHHLLVRILSAYYGDRFGYCEYYKQKDCCKKIPCYRAGAINLSKNHDYLNIVPIVDGGKYLIQFREFLPSLVSNYELFVRKHTDSAVEFFNFAENEAKKYCIFMNRWATAEAADATIVGISYERLTGSPVETMETVVNLFSPPEPLDREELRRSIESVERITVNTGIELTELERGVLAKRDIHSFRYYDEALFRTLDERTRAAYNEIAELPVVRDISEAKLRRSVVGSPTRVRKAGVQDLYVDITGTLAISGITPTGIPRVQHFVAQQAINDPDPSVRVILYDRGKGAYRSPTDGEISQLNFAVSTRKMDGSLNKRDLLRDAFRTIRGNHYLGRGFDRNWVARITDRRSGDLAYFIVKTTIRGYRIYRWARSSELAYFIAKTTIRGYRIYRWALNRARRRRLSERSKVDPKTGIVLMSHATAFGSLYKENISATMHPAFICYDLIPWLHPEFVVTQRQAQRYVSQLTLLVRSGVHALCTSDTSRTMLSQFVADVGNASVRIDQFPLPSILHETAKSLDRLLHFEPEQPFVLYCSTVEIRKNHLLLAKIWKQARDEGVALPKLVCAGKWGWGVESLHAYLRANPDLSERMEFVGPVSDIELIDLYRSALFGVMPSHIEGWGFGASECLDFGMPVIVSTAPGLQEVVRGLMPAIDPSDQAGWYMQIQRWAESAAERETFRKKIVDHYHPITRQESWEAIKTALRSGRSCWTRPVALAIGPAARH